MRDCLTEGRCCPIGCDAPLDPTAHRKGGAGFPPAEGENAPSGGRESPHRMSTEKPGRARDPDELCLARGHLELSDREADTVPGIAVGEGRESRVFKNDPSPNLRQTGMGWMADIVEHQRAANLEARQHAGNAPTSPIDTVVAIDANELAE